MKLGNIEVSGIQRIVEGHKVVWERYRDRWVKYVPSRDDPVTGMSDVEMHKYLDDKIFDVNIIDRTPYAKNRVWVHGEVINIERNALCRKRGTKE